MGTNMPNKELPRVVWHGWANAAGQRTGVLEIFTPAEGYRVIGKRIVQADIYQKMTFVPSLNKDLSSPLPTDLRTRPNNLLPASLLL